MPTSVEQRIDPREREGVMSVQDLLGLMIGLLVLGASTVYLLQVYRHPDSFRWLELPWQSVSPLPAPGLNAAGPTRASLESGGLAGLGGWGRRPRRGYSSRRRNSHAAAASVTSAISPSGRVWANTSAAGRSLRKIPFTTTRK